MPPEIRTRATLRSAEFGFLGVVVYTRVHTPRRCGAAMRFLRPWPDFRPGVETFFFGLVRPLRTSWLMLGMRRERLAARARWLSVAFGRAHRARRKRRGHDDHQEGEALEHDPERVTGHGVTEDDDSARDGG